MFEVFIDGKEGTTGLRIYERLDADPEIVLLTPSDNDRKDPAIRAAMIAASDITFLCLPDEAARQSVALAPPDARIIDTSTAHRTDPGWTYGFPELSPTFREGIANSKRVCVPGCHAAGFNALVYPLIETGLLGRDSMLSCFSQTGYSGGGKAMIAEYTDPSRSDEYSSPRHYATAQTHKHLPEMTAVAGLTSPPVFVPAVSDFYSGIVVTVPLHAGQLAKRATARDIAELYAEVYGDNGLMRPLPYTGDNIIVAANSLSGRDVMEISAQGSDDRICLTARFDNLGKGAAGAAIQCMNLMLGRDEFSRLEL